MVQSTAVKVADSCKSSFNPVGNAGAPLAFPRAASCPVTGSVLSGAPFQGSKAQRRLSDQIQTAADLDNHVMTVTTRQAQADKASLSTKLRRLPQAVQAIITTNRIISGKVFRAVALPSSSDEPSFIETNLCVEISSLASSCAAVSAEAQDALSNTCTPSYTKCWPRLAWQVSTDVLPVPVRARLSSHFFEDGDVNPLGSIVHEVPLVQSVATLPRVTLVQHRIHGNSGLQLLSRELDSGD